MCRPSAAKHLCLANPMTAVPDSKERQKQLEAAHFPCFNEAGASLTLLTQRPFMAGRLLVDELSCMKLYFFSKKNK